VYCHVTLLFNLSTAVGWNDDDDILDVISFPQKKNTFSTRKGQEHGMTSSLHLIRRSKKEKMLKGTTFFFLFGHKSKNTTKELR
jgi:hypothetical protein